MAAGNDPAKVRSTMRLWPIARSHPGRADFALTLQADYRCLSLILA
jgi:hypothetical protein